MTAPFINPVLIVERETTRDEVIPEANDGRTCSPTPPLGDGWRIADASKDTKTTWRRVRLVEAADALRQEREGRR